MHSLADCGILRTDMLFEESPVVISLEVHSSRRIGPHSQRGPEDFAGGIMPPGKIF
jgi:hypothetical protein